MSDFVPYVEAPKTTSGRRQIDWEPLLRAVDRQPIDTWMCIRETKSVSIANANAGCLRPRYPAYQFASRTASNGGGKLYARRRRSEVSNG